MFRLWLLIAICAPILGAERLLEFSKMKVDQPLAGFRNTQMGAGRPGEWKIIETEVPPLLGLNTAKAETPRQSVLAQVSGDPTDNRYPLLILDDQDFGNFTVSTRFKLAGGVVEQMAGIAFRIQNESNYFYIRASGLYNNLRFVPVVNGKIQPPVGRDMPIATNVWHELKIEAKGNQFNCWIDGKEAFPTLSDATYASGKIGFWTKSDAVSYFADTLITYTPRESLASIFVRDIKEKNPRVRSVRIVAKKSDGTLRIIASARPEEIGQPANEIETKAISENQQYVGRNKQLKAIVATLPLPDKNGEVIASVRFEMEPFPGQTEKNVLERTGPILKEMQARLVGNQEITGLE